MVENHVISCLLRTMVDIVDAARRRLQAFLDTQALGRHESAFIYTARRCMHFAAKVGEHHRLLNRARKAIVLAVARYIQMKG